MKIIICGITGSVGTQTLDILFKNKNIDLVGCTFLNNVEKIKKILFSFPKIHVYSPINKNLNTVNSLEQMIDITKPNLILNAIPGFDGLNVSLLCINKKTNLALANKESLVLAGWYLLKLAKKYKIKIFPIDSEHCSLFDLLENNKKIIDKLYITASGGNFYYKKNSELSKITFDQATTHPNWKMGYKISIDSSTLMNKCFEIIEAFYLFKTSNIEALYHPQSLVHSLVKFSDNSIFANISTPNMKVAIQIMFNYFLNKKDNEAYIEPLSFENLKLELNKIDIKKHLPIKWANDFLLYKNKALPIILVCANDFAIELFKNKKINFNEIIVVIQKAINKFIDFKISNIKDIFSLNFLIKDFLLEN